MPKVIKVIVECPTQTVISYFTLPANWDDMSEKKQDDFLQELAVEEQNNVAPCGADVVEYDGDMDYVTPI